MRKLLILIICIITISCNDNSEKFKETQNLLKRISILEKQNKLLIDSISKNEEDYLNSQSLIGIPWNKTSKVGEKDSIVMLLHPSFLKLPKYEIYKVENKKEIKIGENDGTKFNFEFTPKSIEDNKPMLLIKLPNHGKIIELKCQLILDVKK